MKICWQVVTNLDRQGFLGLKSWIIDKVGKPSKKRLSFSWKKKVKDDGIENLDIDEKESHAKMRFKLPKIRNKKRLVITPATILIMSIVTLLIIPGQNIIKTSAIKFLDSLGIYIQEIKSVEIITILVHGILIRVQNELGYIKHRLRLMLILL